MTEYWYNVNTHEVEEDALSDWSQLIGPYKTREEAEHALEKVRARNEAWEKGGGRRKEALAGNCLAAQRAPARGRTPDRGPRSSMRGP